MDTSRKFTFCEYSLIGVKTVPEAESSGFYVPCSDLTQPPKEASLLVDITSRQNRQKLAADWKSVCRD